MINKVLTLLPIVVFCLSEALFAQQQPPWSNVLSANRAVNWSSAGVIGGVPNRTTQCGATIAPYGSSISPAAPTTIINALQACGANQFVQLGAGTFYLNAGIIFYGTGFINNVTLRGMGANQTFLVFSGNTNCDGYNTVICMVGSTNFVNGENNVCDWSSGYASGSTTISLANCGSTTPAAGSISNLHIGSLIVLDQADETSDTGQIWNCNVAAATNTACVLEGTSGSSRTDGPCVNGTCWRSQQQVVQVTNCTNTGGTCTSSANITISPGVYMPNWRSGQAPQAWYANTIITGDGVENLSVDATTSGAEWSIFLFNCYQCWSKGVRSVYANRAHYLVAMSSHCTVQDGYMYENNAHQSQSYGFEMDTTDDNLIQNNIVQQVTGLAPTTNGAAEGNVFAYNFGIDTVYTTSPGFFFQSYWNHAGGSAYNLWEGNIGTGFGADDIHGTHHFETLYRNYLSGWQLVCDGQPCSQNTMPIALDAGSRYFNLVGNVLGTPGYHNNYSCVATSTAACSNATTSILDLGYTGGQGTASANVAGFCTSPSCTAKSYYDPQVSSYLMLWGNWDSVNRAVRWNASEVPSTISPYGNSVPTTTCTSSSTCPPSFFLSSKPTWWGSLTWPGIGPDVSGGNIGQCSGGSYALVAATNSSQCSGGSLVTTALGGHVNTNPAMNCAFNVMNMPVDGSGGALSFNAATCYTAAQQPSGISSLSPPIITIN